jgi:cardiolipin synthase
MACATAVHILLHKNEEPVSAVLWLFIVFTFPLAGMAIYILFGINKVHTIGEKVKIAADLTHGKKTSHIYSAIKRHKDEQKEFKQDDENELSIPKYALMLKKLLPESIPLRGNHIELLEDGTKAYPRMLEEISAAKTSIHLQSFIIMDDPVGRKIFELLEKKAGEGVRVRVIYDKLGSLKAGIKSTLFNIKNPNIKIKSFSLLNLTRPWVVQLRNHRKLIVIDGEKAFVGGINISCDNDYRFSRADKYIHDLHCFIKGPVVGEFQFSFLNDWFYVSGEPLDDLFREEDFPSIRACGDAVIRIVNSGPGQTYAGTEKIFTTAAASAEKYIWIMTPYFVPDPSFWKMLCATAVKGVEIRLIIPEKNNHWYVQFATRSLYAPLIKAGVRIFEKKGPFSHVKAMLVDGDWAVMGSSNYDVRSFKLNYELDFIVSKGSFLNDIHSQFLKEFSRSREISQEELLGKSVFTEILENACALLTPIL